MFTKMIVSSLRYRKKLYIPMLIAVIISLFLIGAASILGDSFNKVIDQEMKQYGANVILKPEKNEEVSEGVALEVKNKTIKGTVVQIASTSIKELLNMNPAWLVKGEGQFYIGESIANKMGWKRGDELRINDRKGKIALIKSGTEFDSFIFTEGKAENPTMILIRAGNPENYRDKNAVILEEMVKSKYAVLENIRLLMFYIALISAVASIAAVINLARVDASSRSKEFGIFKSLGASYPSIFKLIAAEFIMMALISALVGIAGSYGLAWIILLMISNTLPSLNILGMAYVFATGIIAFSFSALIYIIESKRRLAVEELRNE